MFTASKGSASGASRSNLDRVGRAAASPIRLASELADATNFEQASPPTKPKAAENQGQPPMLSSHKTAAKKSPGRASLPPATASRPKQPYGSSMKAPGLRQSLGDPLASSSRKLQLSDRQPEAGTYAHGPNSTRHSAANKPSMSSYGPATGPKSLVKSHAPSHNYLSTGTKVPNPNKKPYPTLSGSPLRRMKSPTERGNVLLSGNAKLAAQAENTPASLRQSQTAKALKGTRGGAGQHPLGTVTSSWTGASQVVKPKFTLGGKSGTLDNRLPK